MSKYRSLSEDKLRRVCDPSFFKFMQTQGLNRKAGVIIPHQNIHNLVLNEEVAEAELGLFHIYAIKMWTRE